MAWTEDKHEMVKGMLIDGLSMGKIAARMHISRNSVIGRVHRSRDLLELLPPAQRKKAAAHASPRRPAAAVPITPAPFFRRAAPALETPPPLPPPAEPAMRLVPLIEIKNKWCRFPVTEDHDVTGHFVCCGADVAYDGATYCAYHHHLCVTGTLGRAH